MLGGREEVGRTDRAVNHLGGVFEGLTRVVTPRDLTMTGYQHARTRETTLHLVINPGTDLGEFSLVEAEGLGIATGDQRVIPDVNPLQGEQLAADADDPDVPEPTHSSQTQPVLTVRHLPVDGLDHDLGIVVEELVVKVPREEVAPGVEDVEVSTPPHRQQVRWRDSFSAEWGLATSHDPAEGLGQPIDVHPVPSRC